MSAFTESSLERKLAELNPSQQSIQGLSAWLIHHRKHVNSITQIWYKEFIQAQEHRKLTFVYLANDVIQNSRKKFPEYGKAFIPIFKKVLEHMARIPGEKTKKSILRILSIWDERGVYEPKLIQDFQKLYERVWDSLHEEEYDLNSMSPRSSSNDTISGEGKDKSSSLDDEHGEDNGGRQRRHSHGEGDEHYHRHKRLRTKKEENDSSLRKKSIEGSNYYIDESESDGIVQLEVKLSPSPYKHPPTEDELIQIIKDLEKMPSTDAVTRGKIANLPPEVSETKEIDEICIESDVTRTLQMKIQSAADLVIDYEKKLDIELEERKKAAMKLQDFHHAQKDLLTQAEHRLSEHQTHLKIMYRKIEELKAHVSSMPDMSKLPLIQDGLAPLPAAGDLFKLGVD